MIIELTLNNINNFACDLLNCDTVINEFKNNPFAKYLIYLIDNKAVGYLYYSDIYDRCEINQLEVEKIHRNCGIATKLMKKLTEIVEKSITLEVRVDNYPAISLYKKFNFAEKAIRKGYYKGIDGILMERSV